MKCCIYTRTCKTERRHGSIALPNQVAACMALADKHHITVGSEGVFTDFELSGAAPPTCWAREGEAARPALGAMIEAIQEGKFQQLIVSHLDSLGTSSEVLDHLLNLFTHYHVKIIAERDAAAASDHPAAAYAASILAPCIQYDTQGERERKLKLKTKKVEELGRLREKIARLERDIADMD